MSTVKSVFLMAKGHSRLSTAGYVALMAKGHKSHLNRGKGAVLHLILAALLSLTVVAIAVYLNSFRSSTIVPAIALINADYQAESAIIMQLQKARFNPTLPEQTLEKEIMPGVLLKLKGVATGSGNWQFNGSITGNQLNRSISAHANIDNPDQIRFIDNSQSEQ